MLIKLIYNFLVKLIIKYLILDKKIVKINILIQVVMTENRKYYYFIFQFFLYLLNTLVKILFIHYQYIIFSYFNASHIKL